MRVRCGSVQRDVMHDVERLGEIALHVHGLTARRSSLDGSQAGTRRRRERDRGTQESGSSKSESQQAERSRTARLTQKRHHVDACRP